MDKQKILIVAAIVLVLVLGVTGAITFFGGDDDTVNNGGNDNGSGSNSGNITLEYWGLWEPESVMQPIIDDYESQNPNIKIEYVRKNFEQYDETLTTRLQQAAAGSQPAPDIFRINNTWLPKYQAFLSPVPQDMHTASSYSETYYQTSANDFTGTNQNLYAVPIGIDGLALYYNKEIFDAAGISEPPSDWDTFREVAEQLTVRDADGNIDQAGAAIGTAINIDHSTDILSLLLMQNGVEVNQNLNTEVDLTSSRAVGAMDFYTSFTLDNEVWSPDLRQDLEMFYSGKLAMMFAPSWKTFEIINANPNIEFGVAPTPIVDQEVYYSMYWGEAVAGTSTNTAAAWDFLNYLSQNQQLQDLHSNSISIDNRAFGQPYPKPALASQLQSQPYVSAIVDMAPNMTAWKMSQEENIEESLRTAIDKVIRSGTTPDIAMQEAESDINTYLLNIFGSTTTQ